MGKHRISNSISERIWLQMQRGWWIGFRGKFSTEFFRVWLGGKVDNKKRDFRALKKQACILLGLFFDIKILHALRLWLFLLADIIIFCLLILFSVLIFVVCISIFLFKVECVIRLFLFLLLMKNKNHKKTYWYKEVYLLGGKLNRRLKLHKIRK